MAPAMSHARVRPRAPSRLFSRLWRTRSRAQGSSDNSSALRSDSTAIFSRSTAHPNRGQPGTPRPWLCSMTLPFRAVPPGCQNKTVARLWRHGTWRHQWPVIADDTRGTSAVPRFSTS